MTGFTLQADAQIYCDRLFEIAKSKWEEAGNPVVNGVMYHAGREGKGGTTQWDDPYFTGSAYAVEDPNTQNASFTGTKLTNYSIGMPYNSEGQLTGLMFSEQPPDTLTLSNDYYYIQDGWEHFVTPATGALSANSTHTRCEKRELTNNLYSTSTAHAIETKVISVDNGDGVIIHQLHGSSETFYIAKVYDRGDGTYYLRIFVDIAEDDSNKQSVTPIPNYVLGDTITLDAFFDVDTFTVIVNGTPYMFNDIETRVSNTYYYWKYGAYAFSSHVQAREIQSEQM